MPIFGLVWVASWASCLFSTTAQSLAQVPGYLFNILNPAPATPNRFPEKPLPAVNTTLDINLHPFSPLSFTLSHLQLPRVAQAMAPLQATMPQVSSSPTWLLALETIFQPYSQATPVTANWLSGPSLKTGQSSSSSSWMGMVQEFLGWSGLGHETRSPAVILIQTDRYLANSKPVKNAKKRGFWQCSPPPAAAGTPPAATDQAIFQIWIKGCLIAEIPDQGKAQKVAHQLEQFLKAPNLDFAQLQPTLVKGFPAGKLGNRLAFRMDQDLVDVLPQNPEVVAIDWVNNLRTALGQDALSLPVAQSKMYALEETGDRVAGMASWYGPYFHGRLTATGEIFDQNQLTAAHPTLPFGTFLRVTNLDNGRSVIVRVNDRGPYFDNRVLDLSHEAARCLGSLNVGVVPIEAVVMQPHPRRETNPAAPQQLARL